MEAPKKFKEVTAQEKLIRVDMISIKADGEIATLEDTRFLLEYIKELSRMMPVVSATRSLMIDLGRGNRDVSFALAEIHNSLRSLDNKDYLASKSNIIA